MTNTFGPYSPARKAGGLCFISGQVGIDPATKSAPRSAAEQTSQALKNMSDVLRSEGMSLKDIVKTTVYLTNMEDFEAVNAVYEATLRPPRPARSTVAVKELPRVAGETRLKVEIEAVAAYHD